MASAPVLPGVVPSASAGALWPVNYMMPMGYPGMVPMGYPGMVPMGYPGMAMPMGWGPPGMAPGMAPGSTLGDGSAAVPSGPGAAMMGWGMPWGPAMWPPMAQTPPAMSAAVLDATTAVAPPPPPSSLPVAPVGIVLPAALPLPHVPDVSGGAAADAESGTGVGAAAAGEGAALPLRLSRGGGSGLHAAASAPVLSSLLGHAVSLPVGLGVRAGGRPSVAARAAAGAAGAAGAALPRVPSDGSAGSGGSGGTGGPHNAAMLARAGQMSSLGEYVRWSANHEPETF
jgi:hypothetical protein